MILLANQRHLILWSWMNTKNLHGVCACKSYPFLKSLSTKKVSALTQVPQPRVQMSSSLKSVSKKPGERKNYLYLRLSEKKEHSSHSVVVLYLKIQAASVFRYKPTTEWLECSLFL